MNNYMPPDFATWIRQAYREPESTSFTIHNMEVAYQAGRASHWQAPAQVVPTAVARPVAVLKFERGTPGRENEMPRVMSCNWMPDGEYRVYLAAAPTTTAQAASSAVLKAIHEANMQLVRTGDDAFMLMPYKAAKAQAADSVPAVEREQERIAFKDAHRHLDLDEVPDAWGRPMFKHSHVEASWLGWLARASRGQAPAGAAPAAVAGPSDDAVMDRTRDLASSGRWPSDWVDAYRRGYADAAPTQPAPAAVAGPSGYGPKMTVKRRCSDCKACNSESYAVQGDSGHYVYCEHPSLPESKYIGDTNWNTPHWCPAAAPTTQPAPQQGMSPTAGMSIAQRILHVGGRNNAAGYVEFGSTQAVEALIKHVLRDISAPTTQPAPQQEAQEPVKLSDEQIKAHGDKANRMIARDLTRFDAACEVDKYLREQAAPGYYRHRMSIVLFGNVEGTEAARAPDTAPQPSPAAQGDALDAARWHWFAEYLVGPRTDLDDEIVASETVNDLRKVVDAARAAQEGK